MARALWLPSVLRAAGLTVHEVPGWQTRGSDAWTASGIICHATAGSRVASDAAEIHVLLTGSQTAPAPIAQLYLGRQGHWWVVASGRCNHALTGWGGPLSGLGNSRLLGIEAANDNRGEVWPAVQYDSYARGVAALCRRLGFGIGRVAGHKEHQPPAAGHSSIKTDPTFPMGPFRARVQQYIAGDTSAPPGGEPDLDADQNRKLHNLDRLLLALVNGDDEVTDLVFDEGAETRPLKLVRDVAELKARPAGGEVVITAELMKALGDQVLRNIAPLLDDVVDNALRRALGSLDGAPPAGG